MPHGPITNICFLPPTYGEETRYAIAGTTLESKVFLLNLTDICNDDANKTVKKLQYKRGEKIELDSSTNIACMHVCGFRKTLPPVETLRPYKCQSRCQEIQPRRK